jgi:cAMP-dependent protein kinase regulator
MSELSLPPEATTPPSHGDGDPETGDDSSGSKPLDVSFHEPNGGFKALRNAWNKKATGQETRMGSNRSHIGSYAYKKDRGDALRKSIYKTTSQHGKSLDGSSHHARKSLDSSSAHSRLPHKLPLGRTTSKETVPSVVLEEEPTAVGGVAPEVKALPVTEDTVPSVVLEEEPTAEGGVAPEVKASPVTGEKQPTAAAAVPTSTATAPPLRVSVKKRWPPTKEETEAKPALSSTTLYKRKPTTTAPASVQAPLSPSASSAPKTTDQASDRTTARMAYRMPQNVYQKPLAAKPEYKTPKFDRTEEELLVIRAALKKNFVFSDLETRDLLPLMSAFEKVQYGLEETIITQGAPGDYFYIIYDGRVAFHVNGVQVGKAGKGNSFGELALLYTCPRAATVVAYKATTTLFRVDQMSFRYILQNQTQQSEKEKRDLLQGVDFFSELSSFDLEKLSKVMTPRVFGPNDLIVKKGELGDAFYVIQEGEILIKDISVGSTVYEDQKLGPGDYFGERSLMTSEPRAANGMALTHGVAFSIDRATFEKILGKISALILRAQDSRQLAGVTLLQKANLNMKQFIALAQALRDVSFKAGKRVFRERGFVFPALYFVRQGKVEITYADGQTEEVLPGGYFGQELLELGAKKRMPRILAPFEASCPEDTILAELRIVDCRVVFHVDVLLSEVDGTGTVVEEVVPEVVDEVEKEEEPRVEGEGDVPQSVAEKMDDLSLEFTPPPRPDVKFEDLTKITLLGAGTFGQVWLVTDKSNTEENTAYALKVQVRKKARMKSMPAPSDAHPCFLV